MQNIEMSFRKSNNVPRSKWPGEKKKKVWHTGVQLFPHYSGKDNPSPNEESMYRRDAHSAYLKLMVF